MDRTDKSVSQIASEMGLSATQHLSNIRTGRSPFPLARIPDFCRATGADPIELLRLCVEEQRHALQPVFEMIFSMIPSAAELELLKAMRARLPKGVPPLKPGSVDALATVLARHLSTV